MQISTKFTIAVHILAATKFFEKDHKITSQFLASSIGSNPVIIRNIMTQLQEAGIIDVKRGPGESPSRVRSRKSPFWIFTRQLKQTAGMICFVFMKTRIRNVRSEGTFIMPWISHSLRSGMNLKGNLLPTTCRKSLTGLSQRRRQSDNDI